MEYENDLPVDGAREPIIAKRTAKDSVFTNLFGIPKYLLQLYQALHPEDKETFIYTGDRQKRPEFLSFVDEFFGGDQGAVEIKVKILYGGEDGDIISQYVTFTKVYNEQIKIHGRTRKAVLETIRICKDKNVLAEYLKFREKEVVDIMMTLFDDDYILKTYVADEKREAVKETAKETAKNLFQQGVSVKIIANSLKVSEKQVEEWVGLVAI